MVNLLNVTDPQTIWESVRQERNLFLKRHSDLGCSYTNILVSDNYIESNIISLEERLQVAQNEIPIKKVSKQILTSAANIFTYMNFCPTFQLYYFYEYLFKTIPTKDIILALLSLLKSAQNADKETTIKVFEKVMKIIEHNDKEQNMTFMDIKGLAL